MSSQPAPSLLTMEGLERLRAAAVSWFDTIGSRAFTLEMGMQAGVILACLVAAYFLSRPVMALYERLLTLPVLKPVRLAASRLGRSIAAASLGFILLAASRLGFEQMGASVFLLNLAVSLTGAWVVIRIATTFIGEPFWARLVANLVWVIAALNILGWLDPLSGALSGIGLTLGTDANGVVSRISLLTVLRAALVLALLYWGATRLSKLLSSRVQRLPNLTPSAQILITKSLQIGLISVAILAALNIAGIDLGALAIFSGAVGLGIGFGLQKIFSNLISGLILLMDRSIKPGDVITLEDTYGHVNALGMRFASVITRDGMEHLIPNEEFITTKVINWSFSDSAVRLKRPIGVAYGTDIPRAMDLIVEATDSVPRVLKNPATKCLLRGFGDNSIDLEVRFWIADPSEGVNNVASQVLLAIWKSFEENGVNFPFPQRDVHLISDQPVRVRMED